MAPPVYTPGQILDASDCNLWFTPKAAYKTVATNRSTLTLSIDPDLQFNLDASSIYEVRAGIIYQSTNAMAFSWTIPASATGGYAASFNLAGAANGETWGCTWGGTFNAGGLSGSVNGITLNGFIQTSASSGTFGFKWASQTGPASLTIGVGSILVARRVG
jgi:hypothetical protein